MKQEAELLYSNIINDNVFKSKKSSERSFNAENFSTYL